jgi:acyl-CoA synthetase (NDP forming)
VSAPQAGLAEARRIIAAARAEGRDALLETEGIDLLRALGIPAPVSVRVGGAKEARQADFSGLPGERVVIKAISHQILHKSELGAVAVVANQRERIQASIAEMELRLGNRFKIAGFTVNQFVDYDRSVAGEYLVGIRWTDDFGAVVTFGTGGIYTEFLSGQLRPGREIGILSPESLRGDPSGVVSTAFSGCMAYRLATESLRGQPPKIEPKKLSELIGRFVTLATLVPEELSEFEVNPMVVAGGELVALDALAKLGRGLDPKAQAARALTEARPTEKLRNLLQPRSIALIGVSSDRAGPGRVILGNLLENAFPKDAIHIVKPGTESIEGCRCYPDLRSVPGRVDLFVLCVSAAQVPTVLAEAIESRKAESIIVIPGGLEEKSGTESIVAKMHVALAEARRSDWKGPLINGGNCLGIRSVPGRYNTFFIPEYKVPVAGGEPWPLALISQSGAFAISRLNKIPGFNPRYAITIGNQSDLTIGDYLDYLKDDPTIAVFAVYVEGFKPLDGLKFIRAAKEISRSGRPVLLYRAGRTSAGAQASASHTASIAGSYPVTRELCRQAGVLLVETAEDFEDLVRLFHCLRGKRVRGLRLGAISNAGFECVAMADNLGPCRLSAFSGATTARLQEAFRKARIENIVDVHNPLDLTPMSGDAVYEEVIRAVLEDENTDAAVVGCLPLTPTLQTLPPDPARHAEDLGRPEAIAARLFGIFGSSQKPWVVVVDAGTAYDPLVRVLEGGGLSVFRTADRALRLFARFCEARCSAERNP